MSYVNEMCPLPLIDQEKHQLYLRLQEERDKLLKNMQEMSHLDWSIDKRLVEAGGRGKTIYYLPARGGSRTNWREIEKYLKEGRDVQIVTSRKPGPTLTAADYKVIENSIRQFKLYSELVKPWQDPMYADMFYDGHPTYLQEPYELEPAYEMRPDGSIYIREVSIVRKDRPNV